MLTLLFERGFASCSTNSCATLLKGQKMQLSNAVFISSTAWFVDLVCDLLGSFHFWQAIVKSCVIYAEMDELHISEGRDPAESCLVQLFDALFSVM
jgi:hypothetical protein